MKSTWTKPQSQWIGGVVLMSAMLGMLIGIGTGSYLWAGFVTLIVGAVLASIVATAEG